MNTRAVALRRLLVANRTIYRLKRFVVVGMPGCHVGVTTDAGVRAMDRRREPGLVGVPANLVHDMFLTFRQSRLYSVNHIEPWGLLVGLA